MNARYKEEEDLLWEAAEDEPKSSGSRSFAKEDDWYYDLEAEERTHLGNEVYRYLEDSDYRKEAQRRRSGQFYGTDQERTQRYRERYSYEEEPVESRPKRRHEEDGERSSRFRKQYERDRESRSRSRSGQARKQVKKVTKTKTVRREERRTVSRVLKVVTSLLRYVTVVLLLVSAAQVAAAFWSNKTALGRISSLVEEQNIGLALFLAVGIFLTVFCLVGAIWALSRRNLGDMDRVLYFDTGRGLTILLLMGVVSLLASWLTPILPETTPSTTGGAIQAVRVLGGCSGTLIPFCVAGVICCVARKLMRY